MTHHHYHHFLLVTLPAQGHINPTFQLAKRLLRTGAQVTFATTVYGHKCMINTPSINGLSYATYSDGNDDGGGLKLKDHNAMAKFKHVASQTLSHLILSLANERHPVTCLIYTILLPWAAEVARNLNIHSALFFIQSANVFTLFYHYFHGYDDLINSNNNDPSFSINLPGLPLLNCQDLPSSFLTSNPLAFLIPTFHEHYQTLDQETNPMVLMNTFDALEEDAIRVVDKLKPIGIGPLITSETSSGCDLFPPTSINYIEWLNSKPDSSVVYVSFGSLVVLPERQMVEISRGLVQSRRPFMWVIRSLEKSAENEKGNSVLNWLEEETHEGLVVPWCSQVEVLGHSSVGCFVTHCGWNSTVESLVAGTPVVACPQFADQTTNAKLVEEVWRKGVRAKVNEEGIVESEEIKRCLEIIMEEDTGEEIRRNAKKWSDLAKEALSDGGSSDRNIQAFVESLEREY